MPSCTRVEPHRNKIAWCYSRTDNVSSNVGLGPCRGQGPWRKIYAPPPSSSDLKMGENKAFLSKVNLKGPSAGVSGSTAEKHALWLLDHLLRAGFTTKSVKEDPANDFGSGLKSVRKTLTDGKMYCEKKAKIQQRVLTNRHCRLFWAVSCENTFCTLGEQWDKWLKRRDYEKQKFLIRKFFSFLGAILIHDMKLWSPVEVDGSLSSGEAPSAASGAAASDPKPRRSGRSGQPIAPHSLFWQ